MLLALLDKWDIQRENRAILEVLQAKNVKTILIARLFNEAIFQVQYNTLFMMRMSMAPAPSVIVGKGGSPDGVHVPVGTQIQVCAGGKPD